MLELFIAVLGSLFSVVNPFGAVPLFLALTPHYTKAHRNKTAFHTSIYFVLILLVFFYAGTMILGFFGISLNAMRIAGGLVILTSGLSLLGGQLSEGRAINKKVRKEAMTKEDISFSPLAMPMLSGPGSISLLISLHAEHDNWPDRAVISVVIIITGVIVLAILRSAPYLFRVMGETGIRAMSRIMGFLVMAIGIQYIIAGIVNLVKGMM
jgi:multiple antibiotic resistance protein